MEIPTMEDAMSASGLDVFDKTLQTTHIWLDQIMKEIGPDRHVAWHVLGAVLRTLRDRIPLGLAAHLGAQLPILIRGAYYDQWSPSDKPLELRNSDEFLQHVGRFLHDTRPVNVAHAVRAVFATISAHVPEGQVRKIRDSLPKDVRTMWPEPLSGGDTEYGSFKRAAGSRGA
jgi:uncharacterized protein (DUF2267 family)